MTHRVRGLVLCAVGAAALIASVGGASWWRGTVHGVELEVGLDAVRACGSVRGERECVERALQAGGRRASVPEVVRVTRVGGWAAGGLLALLAMAGAVGDGRRRRQLALAYLVVATITCASGVATLVADVDDTSLTARERRVARELARSTRMSLGFPLLIAGAVLGLTGAAALGRADRLASGSPPP